MISYDKLWKTMAKRGITQYDLYEHYNINRSLLHRFRNNMNVEILTIDRMCSILNCDIADIVEHVPDEIENPEAPDQPDTSES